MPEGQSAHRVETRVVSGIPVVDVIGEFDLWNAQALHGALQSAAAQDCGAVVVSLENSAYFDSAVMHVLFLFRAGMETSRQHMLLVAPTLQSARRLIEIAGLGPTCASLDDALDEAASIKTRRSSEA